MIVMKKGPKSCTDHLGRKFKSITAMCKHYCISRKAYTDRLKRNWSQESALTTPTTDRYQDHLGKKFQSKTKLYQAYGLSWDNICQRIRSQKPMIEVLGIIPLLNLVSDCVGCEKKTACVFLCKPRHFC